MWNCRSTLVSLLQRHYDPTEGAILLDGETDLREADAGWYRDQLGVVSQDPRLFSESIRENIAYGKDGLTQVSSSRQPQLTALSSMDLMHQRLCSCAVGVSAATLLLDPLWKARLWSVLRKQVPCKGFMRACSCHCAGRD